MRVERGKSKEYRNRDRIRREYKERKDKDRKETKVERGTKIDRAKIEEHRERNRKIDTEKEPIDRQTQIHAVGIKFVKFLSSSESKITY